MSYDLAVLVGVLACVACGAAKPSPAEPSPSGEPQIASAPTSRAEAMRAFFAAEGAIRPDIKRGAGFSAIIEIFYQMTPEECGLRGAEDLPDLVLPNIASIFNVAFPADRGALCARSPNPGECMAIDDNCKTIEQSIFCDNTFVRRLQIEAQATYFRVHSAGLAGLALKRSKKLNIFLQHLPREFYLALSNDHETWETSDFVSLWDDAPISEEASAAVAYSLEFTSFTKELMEDVVLYLVLGHEYAHVELNACPSLSARLTPRMQTLLDAYKALSCGTTSANEVAADLRGIELALTVLRFYLKNAEERQEGVEAKFGPEVFTPKQELAVVKRLAELPYLMMSTAIINSAEYEAIFGGDVLAGRALIMAEPKPEPELERMLDYYKNVGLARAKEWRSAGNSHLPLTVRAWITLASLGAKFEEMAKGGTIIDQAGSRLNGILLGEIVGLQLAGCRRTEEEALEEAGRFFKQVHELSASADPPP